MQQKASRSGRAREWLRLASKCVRAERITPSRGLACQCSAKGRVAVNVPDWAAQAELRHNELVVRTQHLRAPAVGGSKVYDDLDPILSYQQNASARSVCAVDIPLAFDNALVALGQNLGDQIEAIGVPRIRVLVLPD